jgi:hypothetical protein
VLGESKNESERVRKKAREKGKYKEKILKREWGPLASDVN